MLEALFDPGGPRILRIFADNNQRVYRDASRLTRERQLAPISLSWNLRNTQAIHEVAYRHYRGTTVRCSGPRGEEPRRTEVASVTDISGEVAKLVQGLVRQHDIAPEDIAVLVPSDKWREELTIRNRVGGFTSTDGSCPQAGSVVGDTVRRFKGLETLVAVIVVDAELAASDELAYVAVSRSRARTYLVGLPRHLATVLADEPDELP